MSLQSFPLIKLPILLHVHSILKLIMTMHANLLIRD